VVSIRKILVISLLAVTLTACDWVDSTGLQRSSAVNPLEDGGTLTLIEELPATTQLVGAGQQLRNWEWRASGPGNLDACIAHPDFDINTARQSLADACSDASECQIAIEEAQSGRSAEFNVRLPRLRHSLAMQYSLFAFDDNGQETQRQQTICGIAINDPPIALNNEYFIVQSEGLFVSGQSPNSIVADDYDDDDARNQGLSVDPVPVRAPAYAQDFELGSDGSFYYLPTQDAPFNGSRILEDSFVYSISDGNQASEATVILKIVAANQAPFLRANIPDMTLSLDEAPFNDVNIGSFFIDQDGDPMTFFTTSTSLPASGSISLSSDGILQLAPTADETGLFRVTVIASDGIDQSNDTFLITVQSSESPNTAPEVDDIPNRIVSGDFEYVVSDYFFDADGDELEFSSNNLPSDVFLTRDGVLYGTSTDDNSGRWIITIVANDNRGGEVSDRFRLVID